ncbi:vascular cell adhesion protein 1-like [Corythoichthys intestinalis]|uniref:vascular cell adhesion protein 1-like n=1 Tax=Corythoichthys intestinalis TaxID=161448 RepID=UPI0025A6067E|nr:vascular cell adhesion protein 1-like [Corythoichthys intestinalis]
MSCLSIFLAFLSLSGFLGKFYMFANCDGNCADKPVFSPPRLFVEFGSSASATCYVCRHACLNKHSSLEKSIGRKEQNGTTILWTVDKMDRWPTNPLCYYNIGNKSQCSSVLHLTVYQSPTKVELSFRSKNETMVEGQQYTAECYVEKVAPVKLLTVTIYQGSNVLRQHHLQKNTEKKPTNITVTADFNATKEMDRANFWCAGQLDVEPRKKTTKSDFVTPTVFYKPQFNGTSSGTITLTVGDPLHLNCSAEGNPTPSVTWNISSTAITTFEGDVLSVDSVTTEHTGQYICSANNTVGRTIAEFNVDIQVNYKIIIIAAVAAFAAVVTLGVVIVSIHYYKLNRTGMYNLKDVFRSRTQHIALPDREL